MTEANTRWCQLAVDYTGWFWSWGSFNHNYVVDIPEGTASVSFRFEMYQDASRWRSPDNTYGDIAVPISPDGSNVVNDVWQITEATPFDQCQSRTYYGPERIPGHTGFQSHLSVCLYLEKQDRSVHTHLVTPLDFSTIYNVTDTSGALVSRRYIGEPRFAQILTNGIPYYVPWSQFFDTRMYSDLKDVSRALQSGRSQYGKMTGYQNSTTGSNSDVLQMVYSFSGLTPTEVQDVADSLLQNSTGNTNRTLVTWRPQDWTTLDSPLLAGLPSELLQSIPVYVWQATNSAVENVDTNRPLVPFWIRLVQGDITAIVEMLDWFHSALVQVWNLFENIGRALWNFGSWVGDLTSGNATRVARAVEAARQAFQEMVDWIVSFAVELYDRAVGPLVEGVKTSIGRWMEGLIGLIPDSFRANSPIQTIGEYLRVFEAIWSYILTPIVIVSSLIVAAQAAEVLIQAASLGVSGVLSRVVQAAAPLFLFGAIAASIGAVSLAFSNGLTWVFVDQLGALVDYVTTPLDTLAGFSWLLETALRKSFFTSAGAFALMSIFVALWPLGPIWWVNVLQVAFALVLATVGLRDYLSGPDEAFSKVITPFVSTIIGVASYTALITVGLAIASGTASGALLPSGSFA